MNFYTFTVGKNTFKFPAVSYHDAIDKACVDIEDSFDGVDVLGCESWEDVQDICADCNIKVSDLEEIYD